MQIASPEDWTDSIGMRLIITTCTPIQWSIQQDMENTAASSHLKVLRQHFIAPHILMS